MGCKHVKSPTLAHKMEIRQGNVISDETITQLKPGMTTTEVEFLLGPPSITDTFHTNRWDYIYSLEKDGQRPEFKHLTLYFESNTLARIEEGPAAEARSH